MIDFVIEAMVDALLVVDVEGRVTLANSAATQIIGRSREELRGMPIAGLLVDDHSDLRTMSRRRIEDGNILRREQSWLVAKDGSRIPVSVTGSPVLDDKGDVKGIVLVARDVREIRQLLADKEAEIARRRTAETALLAAKASIEEQLDQTRQMLLLAERRATLGTLAGGVGHELRNIAQIQLAATDELAYAIKTDTDIAGMTRRLLPDLERVGEHITQHGRRLMQLARPGPDHVAPIDLNDVVRDVVAMLRLAGKLVRARCTLSLTAEPITITVNRMRIEQILVNLVTNAVDAIEAAGRPAGGITIDVKSSPDGSRVVCSVHDTGTGIPADKLETIFEAFYTTKGELGTGLGLSVVRDIVRSYGGEVHVQSELGKGTTFTFSLPR